MQEQTFEQHIEELKQIVLILCDLEDPVCGKGINDSMHQRMTYAQKCALGLLLQEDKVELDCYGWYVLKGYER